VSPGTEAGSGSSSGSGNGSGSGAWSGPGAEWAGPWANDAQQFFRLLREAMPDPAPDPAEGHTAQSHASPAECRFCPLCQGLAIIRRQGPDVLDRIAELAAGLAATLRATAPQGPHDDSPSAGAAGSMGAATWAASTDPVEGTGTGMGAEDGPDPGQTTSQPPGAQVPPLVRIDISD
jgi:hypothetical protein